MIPHLRTGEAAPWSATSDSTRIPPTYWREGALIGGLALGAVTALFAVELCGYDQVCHQPVLSAVVGFALGGVVGGGVGALIGGQFPKR